MSVRVRIVGDHPWAGHNGVCTGKVIEFKHWKGEPQLEVKLDDAPDVPSGHACFAEKKNLRLIEESK